MTILGRRTWRVLLLEFATLASVACWRAVAFQGVLDQRSDPAGLEIRCFGNGSIESITSGRCENRKVEFVGIVRRYAADASARPHVACFKLTLAVGAQTVEVSDACAAIDPRRLIDATLRVRGTAKSLRNRAGQFVASSVTPDRESSGMVVIKAGPLDPFAQPLCAIHSVLRQDGCGNSSHRLRMRGVVTYYRPGRDLFIQDGDSAILAHTLERRPIRIGETVDIVGFEARGNYAPQIEDAVVKQVEDTRSVVQPARMEMPQVVEEELEGRLVQLRGVVFDVVHRPDEILIVVQQGKHMIGAYLPVQYSREMPGIEANAQIALTGVTVLVLDESHKPKSFGILLRGPGDLQVLKAAPWWNARRALKLLVGALSVTSLIVIWVVLLRRQVRSQTQLLRATLESAADAILVVDGDLRYVDANHKFRTLWRMETSKSLRENGRHIVSEMRGSLIHPDALDAIMRPNRSVMAEASTLELSNGTILQCHHERIPGAAEQSAVLSFRDITRQRKSATLERDRNEVLEAISREDALDSVLKRICALVGHQWSTVRCTVDLSQMEPVSISRAGAGYQSAACTPPAIGGDSAGAAAVSYPVMSSSNTMLGNLIISDSCATTGDAEWKHVVATACQLASLAIEHRRLFDQLDYLAYHDSLSGLLNRVALEAELERAVDAARRAATTFAILCIDLDRFKQINDTLSHGTGDQFICAVASRLCEAVQSHGATVFRVGGDEFSVLLPVTTDVISAESLAKKILAQLRTPFGVGERVLHTTASIGVSVFPLHGDTPAALQQAADSAMYKAKYAGKDQHKVFLPEWRVQENGYFEMEALLRTAIDSNWFEIHYQPKVDSMGCLTGLEALIRIRHPQSGLIAPGQFIAVAEDSGMIVQMGDWALDDVCRQIAAWRDDGLSVPPVAVNVSAAQFARVDFDSNVRATLDRWRLPGSALELEITESLLMKNIAEATELMKKLRQIGITFAIDDFGTGYSSLGYLHSLPVSTVKIDRNFVNALGSADDTCPIINTIVQLARTLSLQVVAEGVETEDQFDLLQKLGCDQFQGFLFSKPVLANCIQPLLSSKPDGDFNQRPLAGELAALASACRVMTPQVLMQ